ncbi:hypothetical protein MD484_g2206, partial [Candolleomyces efflorescens]
MPVLVDQPRPESFTEACMRFDYPTVRVPADLYTHWCERTLKKFEINRSTIAQKELNETLAMIWAINVELDIDLFKSDLRENYEQEVKDRWNSFVRKALLAHGNGSFEEGPDEDHAREFLLPDDFDIYYERYVKPISTSMPIDGLESAGQAFLEATFTIPARSPQGILNLNDTWAKIPWAEKMILDFRGRIYQDVLRMEHMLRQRAAKGIHQAGVPQSDMEGGRKYDLHVDELFSFLPGTSYTWYTPTWPDFITDLGNEFLNTLEDLGNSFGYLSGGLCSEYLEAVDMDAAPSSFPDLGNWLYFETGDLAAACPDLAGTLDSSDGLTRGA